MENSEGISEMSFEQLKEALRQAELDLEEVRYERRFTLGQTGIHLGGHQRSELEDAWARDEMHLKERLAVLRKQIDGSQATPRPSSES